MNIVDMYKLVKHPKIRGCYTFSHAKRGYEAYGQPAQTFFFDKIIDEEYFFVKNTAMIQKNDRIVVGYPLTPHAHRSYSFKKVLKELEEYYKVDIPLKNRAIYIDYLRAHVVYDDGTTLKLTRDKIYRIDPHPLTRELGIEAYYTTEDATYTTITGAEVVRISPTKIELIVGYKTIATLIPALLEELLKIKDPKEINDVINIL